MRRREDGKQRRYRNFRENFRALKQANITFVQIPGMLKAGRVWWKIAVNLHEIEGSWFQVLRTCMHLLKSVPGPDAAKTTNTSPGSKIKEIEDEEAP